MLFSDPDAKNAYEKIKNAKVKYGVHKKALFHLHTPQSHDYQLFESWTESEYRYKTDEDLLVLCHNRGLLPPSLGLDYFPLEDELASYRDHKEWLSFVLLADAIMRQDIEIVVVTDHHTTLGIKKLELAIKHQASMKTYTVYPEVIAGIEISCADRLHVIGIFGCSEHQKVQDWLNDTLMNEKDGTFKTSLEVMEFFDSIGGLSYIAHINTSDIYGKKRYMSGAYKKTLLGSDYLRIVGITGLQHREGVQDFLSQYRSEQTNFIIDNDAHHIDSLDINLLWINGSKVNFEMIKEALLDFDVSVAYSENAKAKQTIKGLYIEQGGFLSGSKGRGDFCLRFSDALNCLIGGRGTGKSTVLQILDYVLGQKCESLELLDFLCQHGNTWILCENDGAEYLVKMFMPYKRHPSDNIMRYFGQNTEDQYHYRYRFDSNQVSEIARKSYLKVFSVTEKNGNLIIETAKEQVKTLNALFDTRYSVNELVKTASEEKIHNFIYQTMFRNTILSSAEKVINVRSKSGLTKAMVDLEKLLAKRKSEVKKVINSFNRTQRDILKIEYSQCEQPEDPNIASWIFERAPKQNAYYKKLNITEEQVIQYFLSVLDQVGYLEFMGLAINTKKKDIRQKYRLMEFTSEFSSWMVDEEFEEVTVENESLIIDELYDSIVKEKNIQDVIQYSRQYVQQIERFTLKFNINNAESRRSDRVIYKDVREVSLGQKVVAMLSFVLGYSDYIEDYRPLIIDQPEDNLDSQYIYKNLVVKLRETKQKRQIIIATHNATIVTNSMADQVCVMASDGKNGWVDVAGYPSERRIKRRILDYLEGGVQSFKHKIRTYEIALK